MKFLKKIFFIEFCLVLANERLVPYALNCSKEFSGSHFLFKLMREKNYVNTIMMGDF